MTSIIVKTLQYPLGLSTFSLIECNRLMKPVHSAIFPKVKICHKFLLDLRYGSIKMLGLGLEDLFVSQGSEKLAFFLEERNTDSLSSLFIRSIYE